MVKDYTQGLGLRQGEKAKPPPAEGEKNFARF